MNNRAVISTAAAPAAIGPYSQAVKVGNTVWISGQIPLDPETMEVVEGGIEAETRQVFANLSAIAEAAGGSLDNSVKINISLTDLANFPAVNAAMASWLAGAGKAAVLALDRPLEIDICLDDDKAAVAYVIDKAAAIH